MNDDNEFKKRIEQLEKILSKAPRGGMLSSQDFLDLSVSKDDKDKYIIAHKAREFDNNIMWREFSYETDKPIDIRPTNNSLNYRKARFLIDPFKPLNVTTFSYDLSIGEEIYSIRKRGNSLFFENMKYEDMKEKEYPFEPGETIIVLTEEYIALPPQYSATIWPRFGLVSEGIFQSMVKIDPTWRGQLAVALTNFSPAIYP